MDPATDRLDAALLRLRPSSDVADKLAALRLLVDYWHGPILPEDGFDAKDVSGLALPHPLLWWYGWAGRRTAIMSGQNRFAHPRVASYPDVALKQEGDRLTFQIENQGCYFWSTLGVGDDPPIFGRDSEREPWTQEAVTLSEHLVLNCIFEAVICHAESRAGSAVLREGKLAAIAERAPALAIEPWRWCETHFYAGDGVFMTASPVGEDADGRYFSVWVGAKREGQLEFLTPLLGDEWEMAEL